MDSFGRAYRLGFGHDAALCFWSSDGVDAVGDEDALVEGAALLHLVLVDKDDAVAVAQ